MKLVLAKVALDLPFPVPGGAGVDANARRRAFVLAAEGGLFFNIHKHHKKTVSDQFFANTTFSFFLVYFWQQPRWSRGLECVWA